MRDASVCFLLLLVALTDGLSQVCFVLNRLTIVRRDSIRVVSATSQVHCNIQCIGVPGCDACMYYADRDTCILLGVAKAPPPGTCGAPYVCYERQTSGCPVYSSPMVDRGYTPGPCSRHSDVVGPPTIGGNGRAGSKTCGNAFFEKIVLDLKLPSIFIFFRTELHDGTRLVLENEIDSTVNWDGHIGSWYYLLKGITYYFKRAKCVRPPAIALSSVCECMPIPTDQPMKVGWIPHPTEKPKADTIPMCASPRVQIYYKRSINPSNGVQEVVSSGSPYTVYCAMGEWINVYQDSVVRNEASVFAVTCVQ